MLKNVRFDVTTRGNIKAKITKGIKMELELDEELSTLMQEASSSSEALVPACTESVSQKTVFKIRFTLMNVIHVGTYNIEHRPNLHANVFHHFPPRTSTKSARTNIVISILNWNSVRGLIFMWLLL